jgi:hypothetical protein
MEARSAIGRAALGIRRKLPQNGPEAGILGFAPSSRVKLAVIDDFPPASRRAKTSSYRTKRCVQADQDQIQRGVTFADEQENQNVDANTDCVRSD